MDAHPPYVWEPDFLGDGYESLVMPLGEDDEGPVVATLVRHLPAATPRRGLRQLPRELEDVDVLYVHGWSDYFFQTPLAEFFTKRGARFFALDLRKYGRSLLAGQTPGFITDLATYDDDIEAALTEIRRSDPTLEGRRRLFLLGHSTGGLIFSLWAARHPGAADGLILNSPWLEFQLSSVVRAAITPLVGLQAAIRPQDTAPNVDFGFYARAVRECADPSQPMTINEEWRPDHTMPVRSGWLNAILAGHAQVQGGLNIRVPICVLLSARSAVPTRWSDALTRADSVLTVDEIARAALKLGSSVNIERIDGALHDVFLSHHDARMDAYRRIDRWFAGRSDRRWLRSEERSSTLFGVGR
ncbi:alpha/beta hydrolase [Rarobacter faecitabidus]|uniref:Alpha-beta hydrolase superfamily lysophospholipase n=1 Tax=Rarobacter faecitabidus TaxID=13243 RepID=A0A542ZWX3_RARFA|nr:alpha/beta hydrolase [Rarobacter faecitabidus]TQL64756.1 alpha-beta hydrolase superfamily lysophospholipase [Rarobacter faecitabidus]